MDIRRSARLVMLAAVVTWIPHAALAEVTRIDIASRTPVLDGKSFGAAGPYEKVVGKVFF
jgi:hypothetical protein